MKDDEIPQDVFEKMLENVEQIITKDLSKDARRDRPYDGQAHTDEGVRGKTLVEGLTMRDVCDCMAMGLLDASGIEPLQDAVEEGTWTYNDLYQLEDFDPVAAIQCMACHLEKFMGIFPNVQKIEWGNGEVKE
jgi:hypothetical protein